MADTIHAEKLCALTGMTDRRHRQIAAEGLGRKCYGLEISPGYCAVILQRFKDATGKTPTLTPC